LTNVSTRLLGAIIRDCSADTQYNPRWQLPREQFGASTTLYHCCYYNSRGQLFDVRLGTDSSAINDGPNPVGTGDHPIKYRRSSRKYTDFKCPYRRNPAGDHPNFAIAF
jgi:hypothetical protein